MSSAVRKERLAYSGLASFDIGDYIEALDGTLCLIYTDIRDDLFVAKYLDNGEVRTGKMYYDGYKRHATVNEITALKLMGLV